MADPVHAGDARPGQRTTGTPGVWTIGPGTFSLVRSAGQEALLHDSREVLERLALQTGETAALAVRRNGGLAYVDEVAPPSVVAAQLGEPPVSLHATSTGKVLLAWSTTRTWPGCCRGGSSASPTPRSPIATSLRAELDRVRQRATHLRRRVRPAACGVSAPVLDAAGRLLAVVSVWGPPPRVAPRPVPGPRRPRPMEAAARMAPALRRRTVRPRGLGGEPHLLLAAAQGLGGEERERQPDQGEADPLHRGHRLVEDEQAQQELERRGEVLQQARASSSGSGSRRRRSRSAARR